jgi:phenylalanyl-tRNA synthetase beta chain
MAEIGGGNIVDGLIDEYPRPVPNPSLRLDLKRTNRLLGTALNAEQIANQLEAVEFEIENATADSLEVRPPSFRVDVTLPEDLMEEVARIWGYHKIPATYPNIPAEARPILKPRAVRNRIKRLMTGFGFSETINYSFVSGNSCDNLGLKKEDPKRRTVAVLNPLSEEQAIMRTSLVPGLLETVQRNLSRQEKNLRLFEIGKIFLATEPDQLPEEIEILAGLWTGHRTEGGWHSKETPCDFYDMKGVAEGLMQALGISEFDFRRLPNNRCTYTRPGYSAEILAPPGKSPGCIGQVHPDVLKRYDVKQPVYIFEINVDTVLPLIPETKTFTPLPKFPSVSRDVTLIVDQSIDSGKILRFVESLEEGLVESLYLFDVFTGKPIPARKKSISFRITYRSSTRTLEDEEVNRLHRDITSKLLENFNATLPL